MRALVVDDSRTMRMIVRRALEGAQPPPEEILEASDGEEALQLLKNERLEIDVVFLDWNMPRLDGPGFLKALQAQRPFRDVAVIMVTSQSQRAHVAEALRWGARDYVVKPFDENTIREKFAKVREAREARASDETSVMLKTIAGAAASDDEAPFLSHLSPELLEELKARGRRLPIGPGTVLFEADRVVDSLCVVLSGQVELLMPDGRKELRGEGHAVGEESFVSGAPIGHAVRAPGALELLQLTRLALGDLVRKHPKFSFVLSALVARRSTTRRLKARSDALSGQLESMPITDLGQVLHLCRKSGELRLEGQSGPASIWFVQGEIVHASCGAQEGEAAVYAILGWIAAGFTFNTGATPARRTVTQPTMALLLEGMRRQDEARNRT